MCLGVFGGPNTEYLRTSSTYTFHMSRIWGGVRCIIARRRVISSALHSEIHKPFNLSFTKVFLHNSSSVDPCLHVSMHSLTHASRMPLWAVTTSRVHFDFILTCSLFLLAVHQLHRPSVKGSSRCLIFSFQDVILGVATLSLSGIVIRPATAMCQCPRRLRVFTFTVRVGLKGLPRPPGWGILSQQAG